MARAGSWDAFRADCARYREDEWLSRHFWWITERSIWAVAVYRFAGVLRETLPRAVSGPLLAAYSLLVSPIIQILTGVELPLEATIGPGIRIYHGSGLVMSGDVVIGRRCTLRQGGNIGKVLTNEHSPRLGDDVDMGAYSQVLGDVSVGSRVKIGPHTVVLRDVPDDATVFGVPGRITSRRDAKSDPANPDGVVTP